MTALRAFFASARGQAALWASLGIIGVALAAGGIFLLRGDPGSSIVPGDEATIPPSRSPAPASPSPTVTRVGLTATAFAREEAATRTAIATLTPASATPSLPTATARATQAPASTPVNAPAEPTATLEPPTSTATAPIVRAYCAGPGGGTLPPNAAFGRVTVAGQPAPAGLPVTLLFDGVPGPSTTTVAGTDADGRPATGYRIFWTLAGGECANRPGARLAVSYDGAVYDTGEIAGPEVTLVFDIER